MGSYFGNPANPIEEGFNGEYFVIFSKIRGVTHEGRQDMVKRMYPNARLRIVREPDNEFDSCAVALYYDKWPLGYISKDLAPRLAAAVDSGKRVMVEITDVVGGGRKSYGANIKITIEGTEEDFKRNAYTDQLNEAELIKARAVKAALEAESVSTPVSQKVWFNWLMLFVFWPYALYLFWKYRDYSKQTKLIIIVAFFLLLIISNAGR